MRDIFDYCTALGIPSLAQGMIELPPPVSLRKRAAETSMDPSVHTYRNRLGEVTYRESIRYLLKERYNTDVPLEAILATQGVTGGIVSALSMLKQKKYKKPALLEPFYTYHIRDIELTYNAEPTIIKCNADTSPDWDLIEKALRPASEGENGGHDDVSGVDVLIVCNPGNPHGKVWSRDEILRLVNLCKDKVYLILDECYIDLIFDEQSHFSPIQESLKENVIVCRGFSKCLGAQSWRIGYAISHPNTIAQLMTFHDPIYISVPFLQHSLADYLKCDTADFTKHCGAVSKLIQRNWSVLAPAFEKALGWTPLHPEGSMYGMFKHNLATDMEAIMAALGNGLGVGVAPGKMFYGGSPALTGYVRIHCGVSEERADEIVARLNRMAEEKKK